jgi:hypothetical protein
VTEHIELSIPAEPELLYLVRFHVAAAAARSDWAIDDVDDLRLAADELCLSLMGGGGPGRRLNVKIGWSDRTIELTCSLRVADLEDEFPNNGSAPPGWPVAGALPSELSERVLGALVDEHGTMLEQGRVLAWLRKQRADAEKPL